MLGGGAGGGPRPEPRRLTATCWPVRVLGLRSQELGEESDFLAVGPRKLCFLRFFKREIV